jgi:hypothetical protein
MEYFLFISIFALFSIGHISNHKDRVLVYYFLIFVVALLVGLRGNQDEYSQFYYLIPSIENTVLSDFKIKEPFFTFTVSLFQYLSLPPQSIYLFFSSIAVIINGYFFKKFTPFYFLAFLIYLSHTISIKEMSGLRLGYASALVLPMIYFIQEKKYIKFLLTYTLSAMVQYVGLLSIFLIFLNREFKPKLLLSGLIIAIVLHYLDIVRYSVNYLSITGFIPTFIADYIGSSYHSYEASLVFHLKTLQQILVVIIMLILYERYKMIVSSKIKYYNLLFNAYYLGTILIILFSSLAIFAFRFSAHFMAVEPIILTYAIWIFSNKKIPYLFLLFTFITIAFINYIVLERLEEYTFLLQLN